MEKEKESTDITKRTERLKVFLKVKNPPTTDKPYFSISEDKKLISLHDKIIKEESSKSQKIELDRIFEDNENESTIYEEFCKSSISDGLDGLNYTFISYGDSTSEKTELITGNIELNNKGLYHQLLNDYYNAIKKESSNYILLLSNIMIYGTSLIDVSFLMNKDEKKVDINCLKDLILKNCKEININEPNLLKDIKKYECENVDEDSNFISELLSTLKKLEETDNHLFFSRSYFCLIIYLYDTKENKNISTHNFIIIPGNESLTTKVTNPNNAKKENIANTKNVVELSYTIEDIIRHLETQSENERLDKTNLNRSKFMAVIGEMAFDEGNLEAQFDRKFRVMGSIYANTGLYYNTKDTLYFLFRCKKIARQKINPNTAMKILSHNQKKKTVKYKRDSVFNQIVNKKTKNELEEKLRIKDDQIYDLESKLKMQETKVAELNSRLENKDVNLKNIQNNYKKQIECLKNALGFKGDLNILLSKDQYTKEYRYALNIRNTMKTNKIKSEIIQKLEEKISDLNKEKMELQKMLDDQKNDKVLLRLVNSKKIENEPENNSEENNNKLSLLEKDLNKNNKEIEELKNKNEELQKLLEKYNKENDENIKLIHNLPMVIEKNIQNFQVDTKKNNENNAVLKQKFIEEAKNISIKCEKERKRIIEKYENSIKQNKNEINNQNKIISEFENKNNAEKNKIIGELIRIHQNLKNIINAYKNYFNEKSINLTSTNLTQAMYKQKDELEKFLEKEVKKINKKTFPLLFEELKARGENIFGEKEIKREDSKQNTTKSDESSPKSEKLFKFFENNEKKTDTELEKMNKDQLINYSKKFVSRLTEVENYIDKYIQYKKGYQIPSENSEKVEEYNKKLSKANDLVKELTAKYNKAKLFIEKNNTIIQQLNQENILLKQKLNEKITLEKLTYPSFLTTNNKKKIKQNLLNTNVEYNNNNKCDYRKTFSNLTGTNTMNSMRSKPDSYRVSTSHKNDIICTTVENTRDSISQKYATNHSSNHYNNKNYMRPFSSYQKLKEM